MTREHDQRDADGGADHGREQDDDRQQLPAEKGADGGEELEVAESHALLAGEQLEALVHEPQHHVAGGRADDGVGQRNERAAEIEQQAQPEQRQCEVVWQERRVQIDERGSHEDPRENERAGKRESEAEVQRHAGGQCPGQRLDDRIACGDRRAASAAAPAQREPAHDRDVLDRADAMSARGARGPQHDEVVPLGHREFFAAEFGALGGPLALHHLRESMNHDVEEAADEQAEQARDDGKEAGGDL